jgi:hypothetical protein
VGLCDDVWRHCAEVAEEARWVRIHLDRLGGVEPGPVPQLDPVRHYLEGSREDVAMYLFTLDSINFGSGWFPTLRKREGWSGYYTVAWALADHFRDHGPIRPAQLRSMDQAQIAAILGQEADHDLMGLYAQALRDLGEFIAERTALAVVTEAEGSAERLAGQLADGMPFFDDVGFFKRAQILPNDLTLAGIATFGDIDRLTIFADNLVPHVLRVDGVLSLHPELAAMIDAGELIEPGEQEHEIRASGVHACELIAAELHVPPRILDTWLWNRGQGERYKALPRHRTRTVFY